MLLQEHQGCPCHKLDQMYLGHPIRSHVWSLFFYRVFFYRVWIVRSSIVFVDFSIVDLIFISRYF